MESWWGQLTGSLLYQWRVSLCYSLPI
jgi:hypothetical protein